MSDALKFAAVAALAGLSAVVSAETIVTVSNRLPPLRAANAETATATPAVSAAPLPAPLSIAKASDGHFWAEGLVNGSHIRFLVDTGATAVALTPADAERLGFNLAELKYTYRVTTAAGETRAAAVKLAEVNVAGARLENVDALVIEKGLDASLLGMSYLGRLASFQATREALILQP
ncbi:TIGR02281 family clan AA aspartic protease [Phenylobacterium sp.]|uniref:TIGR02281 family clan AA aspartic protease n=1 Tax=Phenylobacterium sp. TaxID=1871053 RepID=UPI0012091441|nr:TIGR02281 family clan AA aspartic protease [Phenylobacterium sp.]THD53044.1 MAG: TIGR02281 family clan AA aspartic protease [Phenylobacterium sp.]